MRYLLLVATTIFAISLSSCLKEPLFPSMNLVPNTVPTVGQEFTFEVGPEGDYTCIVWYVTDSLGNTVSDSALTTISGGGMTDLSWTIRVDSAGWYNFYVYTKNCRGGDDDCSGTCKSSAENETGLSIY